MGEREQQDRRPRRLRTGGTASALNAEQTVIDQDVSSLLDLAPRMDSPQDHPPLGEPPSTVVCSMELPSFESSGPGRARSDLEPSDDVPSPVYGGSADAVLGRAAFSSETHDKRLEAESTVVDDRVASALDLDATADVNVEPTPRKAVKARRPAVEIMQRSLSSERAQRSERPVKVAEAPLRAGDAPMKGAGAVLRAGDAGMEAQARKTADEVSRADWVDVATEETVGKIIPLFPDRERTKSQVPALKRNEPSGVKPWRSDRGDRIFDLLPRWLLLTDSAAKIVPAIILAFVGIATLVVIITMMRNVRSGGGQQHVEIHFLEFADLGSAPTARDAQAPLAEMTLETDPPGVLVVLDRKILGATPLTFGVPISAKRVGVELSGPYFEPFIGEATRTGSGQLLVHATLLKKKR